MEQPTPPTTLLVKPVQPWYGCAIASTIVGVAFSLLFLGWMVHTRLEVNRETLRAEHLLALKGRLAESETRAELLTEIRSLDQAIRTARWELLAVSRRSAWLLLISVIVSLVSFKWAGRLKQGMLHPLSQRDPGPLQLREARLTRWTLAAGCTALAATACVFAATERVTLVAETLSTSLPGAVDATPAYATAAELAANWPRFRGVAGAGVTNLMTIPTQWDGASGEGILWKTDVPLAGQGSPVVWKDRVFLSGGSKEALKVFCFDAAEGKLLWAGDVPIDAATLGDIQVMEDTGMAACTVATDGVRVYAIFASGDLICFDMTGKRIWHHALGVPESVYGYASSLEVYRDRVLVQFDQAYADDGKSYVAAFDGPTGKEVWKTPRPVSNSWTSPILARGGAGEQLIAVGSPLTIGYAPDTGKELWRAAAVEGDVAPSPIVADGMVVAIEPYSQMVAVRLDGQGDVTQSHVVWRNEDGGPDICSPVTAKGLIFLLDSQGELACFKVADGSEVFRYDLDAMFNASPSVVNGVLYLLDVDGTMHMTPVRPEAPTEVKTASLGEKCFASPAFVEGRIFIRGEKHLWCIGKGQ